MFLKKFFPAKTQAGAYTKLKQVEKGFLQFLQSCPESLVLAAVTVKVLAMPDFLF